jgi:hypothetical protein
MAGNRRGRGGKRSGAQGKAYGNRTDLNTQAPRATSGGREYGEKGAAEARQRAVPLPAASTSNGAPRPAPPTGPTAAPPVPLTAPSQNPGQPVTAGLGLGAGGGPEMLAAGGGSGLLQDQLRALFRLWPNDDLARLVDETSG